MTRSISTRATAGALIVVLAYSPLLGSINGTLAAAQAVQNTTTNYLYDANGNVTQVTDPLGHVTNQSFDALNRVIQQQQPAPVTNGVRPTIKYGYDNADQLTSVTDPRSLVTNYTKDGLGNQSALASPDTGTANQTFDAAGNLVSNTDARGKTTTYVYDVLNRVTTITYASGTPTVFEYDGGASGAANAIGRLTRMTDESGQTAYTYDPFGRILGKAQSVGSGATAKSYAVNYTYGSSGNLTGKRTSISYPSGNRINYSYDNAGNIASLTLNPGFADGSTDLANTIPLLSGIKYAPFGGVSEWTWGNSSIEVPNVYLRASDLDGRVTRYGLGNSAGSGVDRTLGYDAASRITSTVHTATGSAIATAAAMNQSYGYDDLDRLTNFTANVTSQAYQYDASGNRTQASFGASNYANAIAPSSNRVTAAGGPLPAKTYGYDNAGNLLSDGNVTFTYSDRGRRQSALVMGSTVAYFYNGLGQRLRKSGPTSLVSDGVADFAYDEAGHLLGEYDASASPLQETVYLGDLPVAVLKRSVTTDAGTTPPTMSVQVNVYYMYADHINTPRLIVQASDNVSAWRWDGADPFGLTPADENPSGIGSFVYNPRFPGQLYDRETGLHYNYYRDYDPQTGRYVQSDPIGLEGGINTYGYVGGNPLTFIDPFGLDSTCMAACKAVGGAVGGTAGYYGGGALGGAIGGAAGGAAGTVVAPGVGTVSLGSAGAALGVTFGSRAGAAGGMFAGAAIGKAVGDMVCSPSKQECDAQWAEARQACRNLIYEQMQQRAGRRKKRSVTGVTGGYTDVETCASGLVSQECGGNNVNYGKR